MRGMSSRARAASLALACMLGAALPSSAVVSRAECQVRVVPDVGPACRNPDGSFSVYSRDGRFLGITHGPDAPQAVATASAPPPAVAPACVAGAATDYYFVAIYARASDDADAYATRAGQIRTLMAGVNGYVRSAAIAGNDFASLKFLCSSGAVVVRNEVLPTKRASANFSTIVADLKAKGYTNPRLKYAVFYDDTGACSCAGQGMFAADEQPGVANASNGNTSYPLFAVDYGSLAPRVMLHEITHTIGAVGANAPHTTGAYHCTDGLDVMCYNDGGPKGILYSTSSCSADVFDCRQDDYFNSRPPSGSYLATHWNIASRVNRYLAFPPLVVELVCPGAAGVGKQTYCAFNAIDDSASIWYRVAWGDGTQTRVPASGVVAPGKRQVALHTYTRTGTYKIGVTATDASSMTSAWLTTTIRIVSDTIPPQLGVSHPAAGTLYLDGCATNASLGAGPPVFAKRGCVIAGAADYQSGLARVSIYMGRSHMGTRVRGPFFFEFPVGLPGTDVPIRVEAWDNAGNVTTKTVLVTIA